MKKQIVLRGLLGFPLGITIGYIITIILSLYRGNGVYSPCTPELVTTMGTEIKAVLLQTLLSGILGTSFSACSVIWETDNWSIAKQTFIYFSITAFVMLPVAYLTNWMPHSLVGFLSYFGVFIAIFFIIWIIQYFIWMKKIKQINAQISEKHSLS